MNVWNGFKLAPSTIIKINTCGETIDFLYDTGSQVTIMTRNGFESLPNKPPIQKVERSGTAVDGTPFKFDGVAYLNLSLPNERNGQYALEYETILISCNVESNIYGAQTEEKFRECERDIERSTLS